MHESVGKYVAEYAPPLGKEPMRVLDIGALDVNGNNRGYFKGHEYVGLDIQEGPNVDVVGSSWDLPFPDSSFDCVVSTEMLEHDEHPDRTFAEITRVLKWGGLLIITARGPGYPKHDHPGDFHRFTREDFRAWLVHKGYFVVSTRDDPQAAGAFACGIKTGDGPFGEAPELRGLGEDA